MNRSEGRSVFLNTHSWGGATLTPIAGDASFRSYYRAAKNGDTRIVMDAPPDRPEENIHPFIAIDRHLMEIGLSVPKIYAEDEAAGFLLLEDFGTGDYVRLLDSGCDPLPLFEAATDALIHLHQSPDAARIDLPQADRDEWPVKFIERALLLVDWYLPKEKQTAACRQEFIAAWREVFSSLPSPRLSLMHRDYAAQNFMWLPQREGWKKCGVIDFQDAEIGPAAYDLASMLWDARRTLPGPLIEALLARYNAALPMDDNFRAWLHVLKAQRACRVMGVFMRLSIRDGKHHYRAHLPRLEEYLRASLQYDALRPLRSWVKTYLPNLIMPLQIDDSAHRTGGRK